MVRCWIFVALLITGCRSFGRSSRFPALDVLRPAVSDEAQANAVRALLHRVVPKAAEQFEIVVNASLCGFDYDYFKIEQSHVAGKVVRIVGNTGIAASFGIGTYLRKYWFAHFSWDGFQIDHVPESLPPPQPHETGQSVGRFRYFANTCTFSYSMLWWDWKRWEKHIDWLALNGINLPLAVTGQESVLKEAFLSIGLSEEEVMTFFPGPAFLAWNRMGNFKHWLSPLSNTWLDKRLELAKQIISREQSLGMIPVAPGFAGHVPDAVSVHYPKAKIRALDWFYNSTYSYVGFLDPSDPLFGTITAAYMSKMKEHFGPDIHAYNIDLFNEMAPTSYNKDVVAKEMSSLFASLSNADPKAIWVMQAWLYISDGNWLKKPEAGKALVTSVPQGRMLLLDLTSEAIPIYPKTQSYYGQPFIWNMLHNYGGVLGMRGNKDATNKGISDGLDFPNSTMVGTGLTMEGMFQNYVMYQLTLDRSWSNTTLDLESWINEYVKQRYGISGDTNDLTKAWTLLWDNHYKYDRDPTSIKDPEDVITVRPSLSLKLNLHSKMKSSEAIVSVASSWKAFIESRNTTKLNENFLFSLDTVDVARQLLQEHGGVVYEQLLRAYFHNNSSEWSSYSKEFLGLLTDMDDLLSTHPSFRLSMWLDEAEQDATSAEEAAKFVLNMKNQITNWGPSTPTESSPILDYARKQWSNVVQHYYRQRWKLFLYTVLYNLQSKKPFDQNSYNRMVHKYVEQVYQSNNYPSEPAVDPVGAAVKVFTKYAV